MSDKKNKLGKLDYSKKQKEKRIVNSKNDSISNNAESIEYKYNKELYDSILQIEKSIKGS